MPNIEPIPRNVVELSSSKKLGRSLFNSIGLIASP
jgi:hypothetical protein